MAYPLQQIQPTPSSPFDGYLTSLLPFPTLPSQSLVIALFPDVLAGIQVPTSHNPTTALSMPSSMTRGGGGKNLPLSIWADSNPKPPGASGRRHPTAVRGDAGEEGAIPRSSDRRAVVSLGYDRGDARSKSEDCSWNPCQGRWGRDGVFAVVWCVRKLRKSSRLGN